MRIVIAALCVVLAGGADAAQCPGDTDGDGAVVVAEVVGAVTSLLDGCATGNLLPSLHSPVADSGRFVSFTNSFGRLVVGLGVDPPVAIPTGWQIAQSTDGGALRALTVTDGTLSMEWDAVSSGAPSPQAQRTDGVFAEQVALTAAEYAASFYGSPSDHWMIVVYENTLPVTPRLLSVERDGTDTDANGNPRWRAQWQPTPGATRALVGFCVSQPGTYHLSAPRLEVVAE